MTIKDILASLILIMLALGLITLLILLLRFNWRLCSLISIFCSLAAAAIWAANHIGSKREDISQ